jgi:uncharacterized membrane protein YoaK (UPF0700 family)
LLVGLLSVAMGMQNSALLHFEALTLYTTHVTGLLTHFAHLAVDAIFWFRERRLSGRQGPVRLRELWRAKSCRIGLGLAALWILYVVGALVGAACALRWGGAGVWVACAMLLATVLLEDLAPIRP